MSGEPPVSGEDPDPHADLESQQPAGRAPGVERPGVGRPGVGRPGVGRPGVGGPGVGGPGVADAGEGLTGPDLARAALFQAKSRAAARGQSPRTGVRRARRPPGPAGDSRDPVLFGAAISRLLAERGWQEPAASASVLADWGRLVGPEIADHCQPSSLLDGELVLVAESSAWATQLRLLSRTLLGRLAGQVGAGVVTTIVVRGPAQPDWRHGPRRVQGRGPRDTYG